MIKIVMAAAYGGKSDRSLIGTLRRNQRNLPVFFHHPTTGLERQSIRMAARSARVFICQLCQAAPETDQPSVIAVVIRASQRVMQGDFIRTDQRLVFGNHIL